MRTLPPIPLSSGAANQLAQGLAVVYDRSAAGSVDDPSGAPYRKLLVGSFAADADHASEFVLGQRYGDNVRARPTVMLAEH